jgi:hypothetical protein
MEHSVHLTVEYSSSGSGLASRQVESRLLRGTAENLATSVARLVQSGLENGRIVEAKLHPIDPSSVWDVDAEGKAHTAKPRAAEEAS